MAHLMIARDDHGEPGQVPTFAGRGMFIRPPLPLLTAGALNDITTGDNGAYAAGAGWDACTGWGSPIGSKIASALTGKAAAH